MADAALDNAAGPRPIDSAAGKLKGEITAQTPYGLSTERLCSPGAFGSIGRSKPAFSSIAPQ